MNIILEKYNNLVILFSCILTLISFYVFLDADIGFLSFDLAIPAHHTDCNAYTEIEL